MECDLCHRQTSELFPLTPADNLKWTPWVCSFCLYLDWYKRQGFSFFPLKPRSKEPALASWAPYMSRHPTSEEVAAWFGNGGEANIAVVCGEISHLIVLDFDNAEAYSKAFSKHEQLERSTFVVKTHRGYHVYLRCYGNVGSTEKYESLGFEYRANGSYVVASPSIHPEGDVYKHVGAWRLLEVEDGKEAKELVLERLGYEPPKFSTAASKALDRRPLKYAPPCIQQLKGVAKGFRNEAAMRMVSFMRWELEMEEAEVWKRLVYWNSWNRPPLEERELQSVYKSAMKGGYRYGCSSMQEYCIPGLCRIASKKMGGN